MQTLRQRAQRVDYSGASLWAVEDEAILAWARENGLSPREAQLKALQEEVMPLRYLKNLTALLSTDQKRICSSRVLICGCGGLGGVVIQLLARAGVGRIRVVDSDTFASTNLNRQLLSESSNLSRSKALVAAEKIRTINPLIDVEAYNLTFQQDNADLLTRDTDLVLDALDNLAGRFTLAEAARSRGVPFIHAAVAGWWGQISTFLADSAITLEDIYGKKRARDPAEEAMGVLGPTAAVIGSLEALEAIRVLVGRAPAYSEKLLYFDGETGRTEILPL